MEFSFIYQRNSYLYFDEIQNHIYQWNKKIKFYKTPLYLVVEKGNVEIVKLLLANNKVDVNVKNILIIFLYNS